MYDIMMSALHTELQHKSIMTDKSQQLWIT